MLPTIFLYPNPFSSLQLPSDYTQIGKTPEEEIFHKNFSESDFAVKSKHRRLEGLKNTIKLLAGPLIWLAKTIYNAVSTFFSWLGSFFAENQKTIYEKLSADHDELTLCEQVKQFQPKSILGSSGVHDHDENALITLRSCIDAFEEMYPKEAVENILYTNEMNKILHSPAKLSSPEKIRKAFLSHIPKADVNTYKSQINQARGRIAPTELSRTFEVEHDGETHQFTERSKNLDPSLGAKYLAAISPKDFSHQIDYIESHIDEEHIGIRPSTVRKEHDAQGMTTNAREHLIVTEDGTELESTFRSGAFAVHDKYYPTETEYSKLKKHNVKTMKKLAERWGVSINDVLSISHQRIRERRNLCMAQALPKVIASVKKMAASGNSPEHGFLHVEQSFLSDKFPRDKEMIQDMAVAIETIRQHVKVSFSSTDESVTKDGDEIVINLKTPEGFIGDIDKQYPVHAIFFSQGVNEMQAMGHAFGSSGVTLQDRINLRGLHLLQQHAQRTNMANDPTLNELARHFSPFNRRKGVDLRGVNLIAKAVKTLDGNRGFVCKSGKDRTGSEANDKLGYYATMHMLNGYYNEALHKKIRDNLSGGISWTITGQCNGNANTYAFNEIQHPVLPKNWKPPLALCGNAKS